MTPDPLHLAIALVPLAAYFLVLAHLHGSRRPLVVPGWRDTVALGLGVAGLVVAGPLELFFPETAAGVFGGLVWLLLLVLYLLVLALAALMQRPRLLIYGATWNQLQPALEEVLSSLDARGEWSGAVCRLPDLDVQFEAEETPGARVVQLIATRGPQSAEGWYRLATELRERTRSMRLAARGAAMRWLITSLLLVAMTIYGLLSSSESLAVLFREMLRM